MTLTIFLLKNGVHGIEGTPSSLDPKNVFQLELLDPLHLCVEPFHLCVEAFLLCEELEEEKEEEKEEENLEENLEAQVDIVDFYKHQPPDHHCWYSELDILQYYLRMHCLYLPLIFAVSALKLCYPLT